MRLPPLIIMLEVLFVSLFLGLICVAKADYLTFSVGQKDGSGKYISVSKQFKLSTHVFIDAEGGSLMPRNLLDKPYPYLEVAVGYGVSFNILSQSCYARIKQGVAGLLFVPTKLTTHWQLPTTISAGVALEDTHFGIVFKHFSNGTVTPRNAGREYLGLEFGLVW